MSLNITTEGVLLQETPVSECLMPREKIFIRMLNTCRASAKKKQNIKLFSGYLRLNHRNEHGTFRSDRHFLVVYANAKNRAQSKLSIEIPEKTGVWGRI